MKTCINIIAAVYMQEKAPTGYKYECVIRMKLVK